MLVQVHIWRNLTRRRAVLSTDEAYAAARQSSPNTNAESVRNTLSDATHPGRSRHQPGASDSSFDRSHKVASGKIVYVVAGDYDLCYTTGFFNDVFQDAPIFSIFTFRIWIFFHTLSVCSPAVQFLYRYLVLCREWTPSYRLYAALLSAVVLILLTYTLTSSLFEAEVYISRSTNTLYQKFILTPNPSNVDLLLMKDVSSSTLFALILVAIILLDNVIIVVCGIKMWLHLRRDFEIVSNLNENNRRLQRQVNYVLLVQALLPFVGHLIPVCFTTIGNLMKVNTFIMPLIFQFSTLCVMNANPLFTIMLIKSYRRQILGCCSTSSSTTSTKTIIAVNTNA
ncbi:serpentine type 7TM GPCR chemoreceptor str domain-containing protein [Ditylenchus destructor]|nr:serpentine type 7TM GPCR chemoreceptor str domain-containing protein [Ditylenchus destructor]